ncbi:MAG: hypothetical protein ACM3WV_06025 [Bacillota bacterium]
MIINPFTLNYLVLSFFSLTVLFICAALVFIWRKILSGYQKAVFFHQAEQKLYLLITLFMTLFLLRLFLIPFWFVLLHSLIPSIPGAMCLTGVHIAGAPYSYWSSAAKIVMPLVYGFWLYINHYDRKISGQRLLKWKLNLLPPLLAVMLAEIITDLRFLFTLKPRVVNCCTSVFDLPVGWPGKISTQHYLPLPWGVLSAASIFFVLLLLLILCKHKNRLLLWGIAAAAVSSLISLVFFLQVDGCRLAMGTMYHHCLFCLLESRAPVSASFVLIMTGLFIALIHAVLGFILIKEKLADVFASHFNSWLMKAILLLCAGGVLLLRQIIR